MAMYTMEVRDLVENPFTPIFNFDYPFYVDNEEAKKEFELRFIGHYFFHEIGAETFARWQKQLEERLKLIMPYYQQLYQTQWSVVDKDMMLSKDLVEQTTREVEIDGSASGSTSGHSKSDMSNLVDGVQLVNLQAENKTGTSEGQTESQSESQSKTTQKETLTFTSKGDIGIQTPSYAITEWRKIIINMNEMIINDCKDLFMLIY